MNTAFQSIRAFFGRTTKTPTGGSQQGFNINREVKMKSKANATRNRFELVDTAEPSPHHFRKKLGWLIKEAPDAVRMMVTPEMAEIMMERNDSDEWHNRPQSANGRARFARLMAQGRWKYTGETIVFSESGRLLNGQHRLSACIEAGEPIEVLVAFGVEDDAFKYMDVGIARTPGHIFAVENIPNYNFCASVTRIVYAYLTNSAWSGNVSQSGPARIENEELLDFFLAHSSIADSHGIAMEMNREGLLAPRWAGALHYICSLKSRRAADTFFERVATGLGIESKVSPEYALRKRMLESARSSPDSKASDLQLGAYTVIAWNDFRRGNERKVFRWRGGQNPNEKFPRAV